MSLMEVSESALEAFKEEAFAEGYKKARADADYEYRLTIAQFKKLGELLELEGDMNLMDGVQNMTEECRSHREAQRIAADVIERQRREIQELKAQVDQRDKAAVDATLWFDKQHAADQSYIREVQEAIGPKQEQIFILQQENERLRLAVAKKDGQISELRQALLNHVKETA